MNTLPEVLLKCKFVNFEHLSLIKYEVDRRIYHYGLHFKDNIENESSFKAISFIYIIYRLIRSLLHKPNRSAKVLSTSYVSAGKSISSNKFNFYRPIWIANRRNPIFGGYTLYREYLKISRLIKRAGIQELCSKDFEQMAKSFTTLLAESLSKENVKAILLANDCGFFEGCLIRAAKKCGIPSIIYLHGLPGLYNNIDFNRGDYLFVWGKCIKDRYVKYGVDSKKIRVVGHPFFKCPTTEATASLENVLVLSKSLPGAQPSEIETKMVSERGASLMYLYMVQSALLNVGVKSARLRLHPSENHEWYQSNIDNKFYKFDFEKLDDSIAKASLIIGPTSTVLIESISRGKKYFAFEPLDANGIDLISIPNVPPFDKTDSNIKCFHDLDTLESELLTLPQKYNLSLRDWIASDFSIDEEISRIINLEL